MFTAASPGISLPVFPGQCSLQSSPLPTGSFLGLDDSPSHVVATRSADAVGWHGLAAGGAERQLTGREEVVRPPGTGLLI